jgi:hypothetical protein
MCCFDRCRMRCNLDVLPEWKRPVVDCPSVDCPLMLVSGFYVVEYFFDGEFWLPKLCRRTSVYLWRVLGVTGHELRSVLTVCWIVSNSTQSTRP